MSKCSHLVCITLVSCGRLTDAAVDSIVAVDRSVSRVARVNLENSLGISAEANARLQDYVNKAAIYDELPTR